MFTLRGSIPHIDEEVLYPSYVVAQHYAFHFAREFTFSYFGRSLGLESLSGDTIRIYDMKNREVGIIYLGQIVQELETEYRINRKPKKTKKIKAKSFKKDEILGILPPKIAVLEFYEGEEGERLLKNHIRIERDAKIVRMKKESILMENNCISCEICDFDFHKNYGSIGFGFCEVHHRHALYEQSGPVKTRLEDLAILCPNCHRMIHRTKPLASVEEFRLFFLEHQKSKPE
jgi:HNH endonuclease